MDLDRGSFYVTSGVVSGDTISEGITVRIDQQKEDENLTNTPTEFNIPVAPGAPSTTTPPSSQIIDLKMIKHVISVQGVLATDSTDDAYTKWRNLKVLAGYGGNLEDASMSGQTVKSGKITAVTGLDAQSAQEKYTGNIVKFMFTKTPGVISDGTTTDTKRPIAYAVQMQIAVGAERAG